MAAKSMPDVGYRKYVRCNTCWGRPKPMTGPNTTLAQRELFRVLPRRRQQEIRAKLKAAG